MGRRGRRGREKRRRKSIDALLKKDIVEQVKNLTASEQYATVMEPRVGIAVHDWINIFYS